jgi:carbonic anhydrase
MAWADSDSVHWDCEGDDGPDHWGELMEEFSICEEGRNQSPVDLVGSLQADLPNLFFDYQNTGHLVEQNTGHAIQATNARDVLE